MYSIEVISFFEIAFLLIYKEKLYINKLQVHTNIINCTQLNNRLFVYLLNVKNKYNKVKVSALYILFTSKKAIT